MGARTQIRIKDGNSLVCFYGHDASPFVMRRLHQAMSRRLRWDDAPYLGRIIWDSFCPIAGGELGYGIGGQDMTAQCDLDNMAVVDVEVQQIRLYQRDSLKSVFSFQEFSALDADSVTGFGWAIWRAT